MPAGHFSRSVAGIVVILVALAMIAAMVSMTVAGEPRVGVFEGRVVDTRGKPVEGAFVRLPSTIPGDFKEMTTGSDGRWRAARIPIGYHDVTALRRGYYPRQQKSGSLAEGKVLKVPDIVLLAQPNDLRVGVSYPRSILPGSRKSLYAGGVFSGPEARVTFAMYPYDYVGALVKGGDVYSAQQSFVDSLDDSATPLDTWDRTYSTSKYDGSFSGAPETPLVNKAGTYIVVGRMGDVRAGDSLNVTSVALVVKRDRSQTVAWVTHAESGDPLAAATVEFHPRDGTAASASTDSDGMARTSLTSEQAVVVARSGGSVAFSESYFWNDSYGSTDCLVYTDRPIYRPGHTVNIKGIFRSRAPGSFANLAGKPVEFEVHNPEGSKVASISAVTNEYGTASGSWKAGEEAYLGRYSIRTRVDGKQYDAPFAVEEYRKPEYSVAVEAERTHYIAGDELEASLRANYYFGAPVAGAKVTYTVYRSDWFFWDYDEEFESWFRGADEFGYDFGGYGEVVKEGTGTTDENGEMKIAVDTSSEETEARWAIEARVVDPTMREVVASHGVFVVPADFRVQVEPRRYVARPGEDIRVDFKTLDWESNPVPRKKLNVSVERQIWSEDGATTRSLSNLQAESDGQGRGTFSWKASTEGDILFSVRGEDSKGRTAEGKASVWVFKDGWQGEEAAPPVDTVSIVKDKKTYRKGDTARLLVSSSRPNAALLLTVEGEQLFDSRIIRLQGSGYAFDFPILERYVSNVSVLVTMVADGRMSSSTVDIVVSPEDAFLTVDVQSDKDRYKPGETAAYTVRTRDNNGRPVSAEVSLGVVDESIYALREDTTPDIQRFFWGPRANSVRTYSSIEDYYLGGLDKFDTKVRKLFPDTAYWNPHLRTDERGEARVSFRMPDSLTTWRATARAVTKTTQVGSATRKAIVTKDLIVRLQAPRFFREKDRQTLGLIVHNYTDARKRIAVKLEASGIELDKAAGRTIVVAAGGTGKATVPISVMRPGTAKLIARAAAEDRSAVDAIEMEFPVYAYGARAHEFASGDASKTTAGMTIPAGGRTDTASLAVTLTPTSAGAVIEALKYLTGYPWGCVEQTVSSFVPDVIALRALSRLQVRAGDLNSELPNMVGAGIKRLRDMQHPDGSFGWYMEEDPDTGMTAYVLWSLAQARKAGADVPDAMVSGAARWIADVTVQPLPPKPAARDYKKALPGYRATLESRAFALMAAASSGNYRDEKMAELYARRRDLTTFGLACLGMAAAEGGDRSRLGTIAGELRTLRSRAAGMAFWTTDETFNYWDGAAATALAMRVLARTGSQAADIEPSVHWLMRNRAGGRWNNTKSTAMVILALVEHLENISAAPFESDLLVNGKRVRTVVFSRQQIYGPPVSVVVDQTHLRNGANKIELKRRGSGPLFWTAALTYTTAEDDLPAKRGYFTVGRQLKRVQLVKQEDGSFKESATLLRGKVKAGEILRMTLTLRPRGDASYVILESPLPSGFEVVNRERTWSHYYSGIQIRDEKAALFMRSAGAREHTLDLDVRAEVPGDLNVMPTEAYAMYSPEMFGRSAKDTLEVR